MSVWWVDKLLFLSLRAIFHILCTTNFNFKQNKWFPTSMVHCFDFDPMLSATKREAILITIFTLPSLTKTKHKPLYLFLKKGQKCTHVFQIGFPFNLCNYIFPHICTWFRVSQCTTTININIAERKYINFVKVV